MIYLIDRSSRIASIKSILQGAGLITNIYYETVNYLIFSSPRSNKIIKIQDTSFMSVGDAWTSTTTITNEVLINSNISDPYDWAIVITPDILAFTVKNGAGATADCFCVSFAKTVDASKNVVIGHGSPSNSSYRYSCWDITSGTAIQLKPVQFGINESAVDGSGFYYSLDHYVKTMNGNTVYPSPIKGLKIVLNGALSQSQAYQKFGNDIVVHGRFTNWNQISDMGANFIIINALI